MQHFRKISKLMLFIIFPDAFGLEDNYDEKFLENFGFSSQKRLAKSRLTISHVFATFLEFFRHLVKCATFGQDFHCQSACALYFRGKIKFPFVFRAFKIIYFDI